MRFLLAFFHLKAPKSGREMPAYYRSALSASTVLLALYFLASLLLFWASYRRWEVVPVVALTAAVVCRLNIPRTGPRLNLGVCMAVVILWCAWYIHMFGWSAGVQHFLIPLLVLIFFNVYEPPALKIVYCLALIAFRMGLFYYALSRPAVHALDQRARILYQMVNSAALYILLASLFIIFSTSIQDTERQLRIDNQELHREAGTDPLTQLPNRRAMTDEIHRFLSQSPEPPFCVAIADIDFFKRVNDTYGHNCGDYTLQTLAAKFQEAAGDKYKVCRWGGEEFCFFLPGLNLDDAGMEMHALCAAVKQMPLSFEGHDFSITITIGVAENDFRSPVSAILEEADRKLYMGKNSGRDQVVI
ncbi:MAG: diguanylate cyclase [Clostridia bacterium]|nr:diguanylate cyclase [Clostridia bacterium]